MTIKKLPLERIRDRLDFIYGPEVANDIMPQLTTLLGKYREKNPPKNWENQLTQRDAMLFTYGDSIISENQTPLATLDSFLGEHFSGLLNYVHLLPFYPWTSDDGFAVTNFREVNPTLGVWTQIEELASKFQLVFDESLIMFQLRANMLEVFAKEIRLTKIFVSVLILKSTYQEYSARVICRFFMLLKQTEERSTCGLPLVQIK